MSVDRRDESADVPSDIDIDPDDYPTQMAADMVDAGPESDAPTGAPAGVDGEPDAAPNSAGETDGDLDPFDPEELAEGQPLPRPRTTNPGAAPGIDRAALAEDSADSPPAQSYITVIDYCAQQCRMMDVLDLGELLEARRPEWSKVRWINVDGLGDLATIEAIAAKWQIHPLAVEDIVHVPQRPKVEDYPGDDATPPRLLVIARMIQLRDDDHLHSEQVSFSLGRNTIVTFQETHGDVWTPIRQRIANPSSRLRANDASFLAYALLDAVVDHCFPILEHYGDQLERLERQILDEPTEDDARAVQEIKRELLLLRRQVWPMRDMIQTLLRDPHPNLADHTRTYLRDVHDHLVQIIDLIETYREVTIGLNETYQTAMSNRMNQIMKVLTIIATIFIPLTFLAGVYGMNMNIPENHWGGMYATFWVLCGAITVGMLALFRRSGWL